MEVKAYRRRFAKRSKYQRLNNGNKKSWRVKIIKRLRWTVISPRNLWTNFKNAYIILMSNMAGKGGCLAAGAAFPTKKLPARASSRRISSNDQFHERLLYEIYKNFIASRELATI
ncbi:hypothetical protein L1987_44352 [Smallanthus sonchifolius]|uniref:Uncharacterized protein n=1 Tax=Smallanthus sonchifolius TaxID=185202 RepID=A0ACB9GPB5_9ASTR|nr:hypothetical protein L1987_44352 [Smallanthus sonchifolius]